LNGLQTLEGADIWRSLEALLYEKLPSIFVPPEEQYLRTITLSNVVISCM
jgi:hypothetical protein